MIPLEKRKIPVFGKRKACVQASMPASENVPAEKSRLLQDRNHSTKSIVYGNEHKNSMPKVILSCIQYRFSNFPLGRCFDNTV